MDTKLVDHLLSFLPRFDRGEFAKADEHYRSTGQYVQVVDDLMRAIGESDLLVRFDWVEWKQEATRYSRDPGLVSTADLETVRRLLTTAVRQDRFVGGLMPALCSSGLIKSILERLAEIRREAAQQGVGPDGRSPAAPARRSTP